MVANENPFDPTLPDNTSNEISSTVDIITLATRSKRFLTSTLVVFAFASIGCWGIAQFQEKRFLIAYVAVSIALMLIPIADHTSTLRQRLLVSLVMPFALAGLAVFVWIYFLMFRLSWFERVFNSKDTGPVGMILFALAGLVSGGIMGWRLINYRRRSKIAYQWHAHQGLDRPGLVGAFVYSSPWVMPGVLSSKDDTSQSVRNVCNGNYDR